MKTLVSAFVIFAAMLLSSCEPSGRAKGEMEKFSGTPTPAITPTPEQTPILASDIVQVDTSLDGDVLTVNNETKKSLNCNKYNQVAINADASVVSIKGVCQKITVNADRNHIAANAAMEFAFNGTGNQVTYSQFGNGKQPIVTQNQGGNTVYFVSIENLKLERKNGDY
jgi:hypothetical protein